VLADLQRDAQARGFLRISTEARRLLASAPPSRLTAQHPVLTQR